MKITIKDKNGSVEIRESRKCEESDVVNAFAYALAMKCGSMFKNKVYAMCLLNKMYDVSRQALNDVYDKRAKE